MAQIWLGFGGCKFSKDGITATFSGGVGIPDFIPYQTILPTVNHAIASRLYGFKLVLDIKELYNLSTTDYLQYQYLAQILTALVDSDTQQTVTVTPRNDSTITPLTFECILTSSVTPADIHRVKTGQVMPLQFTCITMQTSIPTTVGDMEDNNWVFETSDGVQENAVFETSDATQENAVLNIP